MPTYDYQCGKCKKKFALTLTVSQHETKRVRCPKCASGEVKQSFQAFFVTTSKKS